MNPEPTPARASVGRGEPLDHSTLLELYKLHLQMAGRVSDRRLEANAFYVSLTVGILVLASRFGWLELATGAHRVGLVLITLLGLLVCSVWRVNVSSFQRLNRAKFQVIHQLERQLPFAAYELEWKLLGQGGDGRRYLELRRLEKVLPVVVAVPYLVLIAMASISLLMGG